MARSRVLGMDMDADPGPARAVAGAACAAAVGMRETKFWNLLDRDLLSLAQSYEKAARLVYAAQVQPAGEINTRNLAGTHGCTSTAALLRHGLTISAPDARARVAAGTAVLPPQQATGFDAEPALPMLGAGSPPAPSAPNRPGSSSPPCGGFPRRSTRTPGPWCRKPWSTTG